MASMSERSPSPKSCLDRGCLSLARHGFRITDIITLLAMPEFVMDSSKMLSRLVFERPFGDSGVPSNEPSAIYQTF